MGKQSKEKLKILLVEDRPDWRAIFRKTIGINYDVIEVESLKAAEGEILNPINNFALAIVDIRLLPERANQDGLLILQLLKENRVPTIATSAYASPQIVRDAFFLGEVKDFWFKDAEEIAKWRGDIQKIFAEIRKDIQNQLSNSVAVSPREVFIQKAAEDYHQVTLGMLKEPQAQLQRWFVTTQIFMGISLILILIGAISALFWNLQIGTLTSISSLITGTISTLLLKQLNQSKKDFELNLNKVLGQYKNALKELYGKVDKET